MHGMKQKTPYEGRETEKWWWGSKSHPTQHHDKEYNPDDEQQNHRGQ